MYEKSRRPDYRQIPGLNYRGPRMVERDRLLVKMSRALLSLERIEATFVRGKNCQRWIERTISAAKRYKNPYLNPYGNPSI